MQPLAGDFRTVRDAAKFRRVNYYNLLSWIVRNDIPMTKVGNVRVVRLSDIEGYIPRKDRKQ